MKQKHFFIVISNYTYIINCGGEHDSLFFNAKNIIKKEA